VVLVNQIRFARSSPLVALALLLSVSGLGDQQNSHHIKGVVVDDQNRPIPGVKVTAYQGVSDIVGRDTTEPNGEYTLAFKDGPTITSIVYENSEWNPEVINNISGNRDETINKVLHPVGTKETTAETLNTLDAYRAIFYANDAEKDPGAQIMLRRRYAHSIQMVDVPEHGIANETKSDLLVLYQVPIAQD
jgi:hypothetical protein